MQEYKIGARLTGKCVTMFTEHTGTVISSVPSAFYSDGRPREYRTTIKSDTTGLPVILWPGTEEPACAKCGPDGTHSYSEQLRRAGR